MARDSLKNVIRMINETAKEFSVEQSFLADLKRSIELTAAKEDKKGSQSYKPSSMNCIRQMYYIVTGTDPVDDVSTYIGVGICNSGSDIHQRIQQAVLDMKDNGIDCEYVNVADYVKSRGLDYIEVVKEPDFEHKDYETKLYHKTLNMSFLCDGVIRYRNKYYILEFKTETSNKFWSRAGVDPSHFNQGTAYSLSLQIDDVIFVYISRDSLDMKSYLFTPTGDMKQDVVGRITVCDGYVKELKVPPKPTDVPRKACEYCGFKTQCRKDG